MMSSSVFDLETVILHELGHALGLDHPDQACARNAAFLNPNTYAPEPCTSAPANAVMAAIYAGVKRELTPDDIGGLSFLYRPRLAGDLQPDDQIDLQDAVAALEMMDRTEPPTPYEVNIMDFGTRNGVVDLSEVMQVVESAFTGVPIPDRPKELLLNPTTITILDDLVPSNAGLSTTIALTIRIQNPNAVAVSAWDIDLRYDRTIFTNPRLSGGTFLVQGAWVNPGPDDGEIRFSKIGIASTDSSVTGTLGTVTFDVNLAAAAAGPAMLQFPLVDVELVASTPFLHTYAETPGLQETLTIMPPFVPSYIFDATGDNLIDIRDLYAFYEFNTDVDKNGMQDQVDHDLLRSAVRQLEPTDIVTGR